MCIRDRSRIAIANTYAASVMKMLGIDMGVVVGVSGDFHDEELWPELSNRDLVQQSAHSEIDFEALLDTRPDVYVVFATNGMVDTNSIREKLEPIGIKVLGLDFYKYDSLRAEIGVMASIFNKQSEAMEIFSEFDAIEKLIGDRLAHLDAGERPNVVMEHHASLTRDPVVLTGTSQWTDIIDMAGGINVFEDLPGHTTHVDMEAILDANPDVLMFDGMVFDIGFNSFDENGECDTHFDFIESRPGFDKMAAVEYDRMAIMSSEFAGPMMIHGLPSVAKILHPELFDDIDVIPCHYKRQYIEWQDRGTSSGAPVAIHEADSDIVSTTTRDKGYKDRLPNGNYLENTASYFVMMEDMSQALITMKSTQLKVSRSWNSMMNTITLKGKNGMFTPASYSHVYNLGTVQQSNDKGTWFGWNVEKVGPVQDKGLYEQAKSFAVSANKGDVTAKHGEEDTKSKDSVPF